MSGNSGVMSSDRLRGKVARLALVVVLTGCTGPGEQPRGPDAGTGEPPEVVVPAGVEPGEGTEEQITDLADTGSTKREPLVELRPGIHAVNVRTGASTRLPSVFTEISGAGNYDVSPDGSMILFDTAGRRSGRHRLYVANLDGSQLRRLTDPLGAYEASWSPDGTRIVYLSCKCSNWLKSPAELTVWDLATDATTRIASGLGGHYRNPTFTEDGSAILVTRPAPRRRSHPRFMQADLWTIPVDGGRPELLLRDRGYAVSSPDGSAIAFPRLASYSKGNFGATYAQIWISDPDGDHARKLISSGGWHGGTGQGRWSPTGRWMFFRGWGPPDFVSGPLQVLDMRTGRATPLARGAGYDWLDDHTLLVERPPPAPPPIDVAVVDPDDVHLGSDPEHFFRVHPYANAGTVAMTNAGCGIDTPRRPIGGDAPIKIHFENATAGATFHVGRLEDGFAYKEVKEWASGLTGLTFTSLLEPRGVSFPWGRFAEAWYGNHNEFPSPRPLLLHQRGTAVWVGSMLDSGTFLVLCYRGTGEERTFLGMVGPIEVRR